MSKYIFLIDGFNIFHKIKHRKHIDGRQLKWCNYNKMLNMFIKDKSVISSIYYFSALTNNEVKRGKHKRYIELLEKEGITTVLGNYKKVTKTSYVKCDNNDCRSHELYCGKEYNTLEEKQTDVNIGAYLIDLCYQNPDVDTFIILSADSDYLRALKLAQYRFKDKKFGVMLPPGYPNNVKLAKQADFPLRIRVKHLKRAVYSQDEIEYITTPQKSDKN